MSCSPIRCVNNKTLSGDRCPLFICIGYAAQKFSRGYQTLLTIKRKLQKLRTYEAARSYSPPKNLCNSPFEKRFHFSPIHDQGWQMGQHQYYFEFIHSKIKPEM